MLDAKALADATAAIVKTHVDKATTPLLKRIEALEAIRPEKGETGERGEKGDSGVGVAGAVISREGVLVLTLSDGTTRDLGPVVGKDGADGSDGMDGSTGEAGKDGRDGKDGVGFDDLEVIQGDNARSFTFRFAKGDTVKEFPFELPVVLDRGVFRASEQYQAGDGVTWAGSFWIAQKETSAKPGEGEDWRLAVKRGRDGKDKA